jgi:hypothetical protein
MRKDAGIMHIQTNSIYVGEESRQRNVPDVRSRQAPNPQMPEESYYVYKKVFSQLTPCDIPQPQGYVYRG